MLDAGRHQGFSLRSMALEALPQVVAMASHGDQQGELPLLWDLCSTYTGLGYQVAVVDATTAESEDNPGLAQLLDHAYWPAGDGCDHPAWPVLPAALGLKRLGTGANHRSHPLMQLTGAFQNYNVVLVYARAEALLALLTDSSVTPLLAVSSVGMSRVTAYQALKLLLLNGKLRPTIVSMVHASAPNFSSMSRDLCKNLRQCAMTFLGHELDTVTVQVQRLEEHMFSSDMHTLALRLLENAMPLHRPSTLAASPLLTGSNEKMLGSH